MPGTRGRQSLAAAAPCRANEGSPRMNYDRLGTRKLINGSGTITTLGGSLMPEPVLQAMSEAAGAFIDLHELGRKAGEYLARRIGVESAYISCGAASGMQLSAAACLTDRDSGKVAALPHTDGWKNEFVISLVDRHTYIHQGIEICGGKLVRVGTETEVTARDILDGLSQHTAAIVFFLGKQSAEQLAEVVAGANHMNVPVIVDAAAQVPPRSNLTEIVNTGASLVVFSGGKGIRGPQSSGLVLGKRQNVDAVRLNANPYSAIGRGMKVGKEEIMGLVAAVDCFLEGSDHEDRERWNAQAETIVACVQSLPGIRAYVMAEGQDAAPDFAPRAYIDLDNEETGRQVIANMLSGEPPIAIRRSPGGILVDPMTLMPGEEQIVGNRLAEVLNDYF